MFKKNAESIETEEMSEGAKAAAEHTAAEKKSERIRTATFAAVMVGVVVLSVKYIHTPVPEWADDSEDV